MTSTASSWVGVMAIGFSWRYPCAPISWPASTIGLISFGKVSIEWPGMKNVVFRSYFLNSLSRRILPTSLAKTPRWMSDGESPPP